MTNAFEYGDALLPDHEEGEGKTYGEEKTDSEPTPPRTGSNTPYINLAT